MEKMKIYFAEARAISYIFEKINSKYNFLESYFYCKNTGVKELIPLSMGLFLDSGAYSARSKGIEIDIDKYLNFVEKKASDFNIIANLDSIGDAEQTLKNQKYMESKGLYPLPCYHLGEPEKFLEYYVDNYEYIALGGMVGTSTSNLEPWLDNVWWNYLVDQNTGRAKIKVHGFGMTSVKLMKKYPWYSVDSTSWVLTGGFGGVFCSNLGNVNNINVSKEGNLQGFSHFYQFPKYDQERIRKYFRNLGRGYEIEELASTYKVRHEVNIIYFLELEKQLTINKPIYINKQENLF